jgi:hypothetical protein
MVDVLRHAERHRGIGALDRGRRAGRRSELTRDAVNQCHLISKAAWGVAWGRLPSGFQTGNTFH